MAKLNWKNGFKKLSARTKPIARLVLRVGRPLKQTVVSSSEIAKAQGHSDGKANRGWSNPYKKDTVLWYAYSDGFDNGNDAWLFDQWDDYDG